MDLASTSPAASETGTTPGRDTPAGVLHDLFTLAEIPAADQLVAFHGADPVLPTPFRIGDLGAAAIAATAAQAARLFAQRTGMRQAVHVDVDAAAVAMRSSRYLTSVPAIAAAGRRPVGLYRTGDDRYFYFQRLFPHHFARQAEVLGLSPEASDEDIAGKVATRDGQELEDAVIAGGACGALVRSAAQWDVHEQARALAATPLFSVTRTGDSAPEPVSDGSFRPLAGVRVLDLTRVLAGPACARTLAEHGADVLRVGTSVVPDDEQMMRDGGHGKRSAELDLKSAAGADALRRLVAGADVFSQGYRPGALDRLGFSPAELARIRPGIVTVSLSAFGTSGPWSGRRGFDSIVQSVSGIASELAGTDGVPRMIPANPLDYTTGYLAAFGALVALERRARHGGSYHVEVSLAQTGRYLRGLGRADPALVAQRAADLPAARIDELMITRRTPFGMLRYFAPVARLTGTPGRWDLPSVPLDSSRPEWM